MMNEVGKVYALAPWGTSVSKAVSTAAVCNTRVHEMRPRQIHVRGEISVLSRSEQFLEQVTLTAALLVGRNNICKEVDVNAGLKQTPSANDSSAACLNFPARPGTPEAVRKFRKSYFAEPGTRIVHPGLIDDVKHIDATRKFGITSKNSDHVSDIMPAKVPTEHALITQQKLEALYMSSKREPLGTTYSRGHHFDPTATFGAPSEPSDVAKDVLYGIPFNETAETKALYKRSHGSCDPGEQKNRQYANVDLAKARFGMHKRKDEGGVEAILNPEMDDHVSKVVIAKKNVEDMKNTMDMLGKPRNLGFNHATSPDHVFGVKHAKGCADAALTIHGSYSFEEQQPDADLGKPVNRGTKTFLTNLFSKMGYDEIPPDVLDQVYVRATLRTEYTPKGVASIQDFREVLNDYLDARDAGLAAVGQWKAQL
ncbi:hypothetical protein DYB28_005600 [Aphanomyces astaci]|uniref:Uncharacterized protein n=1 Tax=Aphanomyces astaci TaxID=112090 RepID=A0A9X8HGM9_APHAT|nr:hypothetical protein DYB28_005600 [Aphanomyces astaci]